MFIIDRQTNRISSVNVKCFSELGFTERKHLQEWLTYQSDALGEELLIIQKEFDGFDDTRERLDLLALDKDGNLVIIENKLDDSGRDVVWQVIKYASYCASLTKGQIVDIYQQYLNKTPFHSETTKQDKKPQLNAADRICEFLEIPDLDEVKLNLGNSQRLMLVAANFRKEVTSTALWLLGQGINIQCFKVTPYALNEQLFLEIDHIIPTPEAKELMIGISAKEAEEKNTEVVLKNRHSIRRQYWELTLEVFQKSSCTLYNNISPSKDHWLSAGSGLSGCPYNLIFSQKELRVELWLSKSSTDENKFLFDYLFKMKNEIENTFGSPLEWMRLDDKKACRIQFSYKVDGYNKEEWPQYTQWHLVYMSKFERAFKVPLKKAANALKQDSKNKL
ncbi:DUF4268 domain-containing protein [Gilliamella sp. wkB171]|uniref:DUF4268 domain-containing protein n=1 Tax=Gilliamella sp. wkB171 TaxID=3120258 RepID=UPI000813C2AF|nr:DUF4268 domain-containing protein [Gilliamella apicola]OCL16282.1 hypothetical protein A9G03_11800 [Gilliamella apicola]